MLKAVIPGLTRNPAQSWIPAFAGKTTLIYIVAGVISCKMDGGTSLSGYESDEID
jgi:hypothetical protein